MPQRRVAATGFGGSPLSILGDVAQGVVARQKSEREAQRQAILNRLARSQTDQVLQATRLAKENALVQQQDRERAASAREAAVRAQKQRLIEQGHDPSDAEDMAIAFVAGKNPLEFDETQAGIDQSRAATASSRSLVEQRRLRNQSIRDQAAADELIGNDQFSKRANAILFAENLTPAAKEAAVLREARERFGASGTTARIALDKMREQALALQQGGTQGAGNAGGGNADGSIDPAMVQSAANARIRAAGSRQAALEQVVQRLASLPPDHPQRPLVEAVARALAGGDN